MKKIPPPYEHQIETSRFILDNKRTFITSDPGTGKTRSVIDARSVLGKRMLVFAPLSILQSSWGDDIDSFAPLTTYEIAFARNRKKAAARTDNDVLITNHDAVKWFADNPEYLADFDIVVIDESTAFKNKDSKRSKAMVKVAKHFERRILMTGTPNPNTVLDMWHQMLILDDGERLGRRFFTFRGQVCTSTFNGFANEWHDKPEAQTIVASQIMDINIRHVLEECLDMPEHVVTTQVVSLPKKIMDQYKMLADDSILETTDGQINAVHAGAKVKKLLQLCTGAVYNEEGEAVGVHEHRYDLVLELVQQRKHSLVAFNWRHEREYLTAKADKLGLKYGVIDGTTHERDRPKIVKAFQNGELDVVFAHPQSAGHGLTFTRATATIWCSPTYNAEHYTQFNRRIYRAGQTKKTETICIAAKGTWEPAVYTKLSGKVSKMSDMLGILSATS